MLGMFGRAVILLATMTAALVLPVLPGASADPYSPTVDTQVHVNVKPVYKENVRVKVSARVSVNGNVTPTGEIKIKVGKVGNGPGGQASPRALAATEWSTTVRYEGDPIKVSSPGFSEGSYVVDATFVPDDAQLRRSSDSDRFAVKEGGPSDQSQADDDAADGSLPSTGGPSWWWLVAGLVLVGGGAAVLVLARRRRNAATAPASEARPEVTASV